jgi:hypothetical protein
MLIDVTLRFTWILYIAMPQQLQHSAITSFGISVGEVCRRGLWSLFRIENEHCNQSSRSRTCGILPSDSRYIPELEPEAFRGGDIPTDNSLAPTDANANQIVTSANLSFPDPVVSVSSTRFATLENHCCYCATETKI